MHQILKTFSLSSIFRQQETPAAAPLKGFQILLIICAILFLSLVLLGLAASYYCLRNQRIQVIRRHPLPLAGSEITKISDTSTGNLSMYEGLKIPRAHAHMTTTASLSESEVAIVSGADTIPSDYPSESPSTSHSEVEDVDGRSLRRSLSSSGSYENKAYMHESSYFSEQVGHLETEVIRHRPPPPEPKFNVEMRVKKAPLPPPTPSPASSDSEGSLIMQERNLSTIHERDEIVEMTERPTTFTYKPEIHPPPKSKSPPIYSEVVRKNLDKSTMDVSKSEYVEETFERTGMEESDFHRTELQTEVKEPPVVVSRRPEITSHFVDDVFLRTITEKKTIEDIERHRRQVTEYHAKPLPPPTKWDVEIRNYPNPNAQPPSDHDSTTDWDTHSENSSIYGVPPVSRSQLLRSQMNASEQYRSTLDIPVPNPPPANWDSLVRVLEQSPMEGDSRETYRSEQVLTLEDKKKWRKIITTESTLRTLLTDATVREDYERIRRDQRYEKLFEPQKWDVIIRILTPQDRLFDQKAAGGSNRYRRKSEWDTRSRRNSLPTLYEYDSDGSSIKHLNLEMAAPGAFDPLMRSRRTSKSSMRSDIDVRSMSEIMVDFARPDVPDNMSDGSSYYRTRRYYDDDDEDAGSLVRSLSQPSLARSASEFTESWGIRGRNWDSPEHSPRSSMRSSRHEQAGASSYNVQRSMYQEKRWYGEGENDM